MTDVLERILADKRARLARGEYSGSAVVSINLLGNGSAGIGGVLDGARPWFWAHSFQAWRAA